MNADIAVQDEDEVKYHPNLPKKAQGNPKFLALLLVLGAVAVDFLGVSIVVPVLPFYALAFGASKNELGYMYSAFAAAQIISTQWMSIVSDKHGRRVAFLLSFLGSVVGFFIQGVAWDVWSLLVARFLAGLFSGSAPVAMAYISDVCTPTERPKWMASLMAVMAATFLIGPAIGAGLAEFSLATPMFVSSGVSFVGLLLAYKHLKNPETVLGTAQVKHLKRLATKEALEDSDDGASVGTWEESEAERIDGSDDDSQGPNHNADTGDVDIDVAIANADGHVADSKDSKDDGNERQATTTAEGGSAPKAAPGDATPQLSAADDDEFHLTPPPRGAPGEEVADLKSGAENQQEGKLRQRGGHTNGAGAHGSKPVARTSSRTTVDESPRARRSRMWLIAGTTVVIFCNNMAFVGLQLLLPLYFGELYGYTSLQLGYIFMATSVVLIITQTMEFNPLQQRIGLLKTAMIGGALHAAGHFCMTIADPDASYGKNMSLAINMLVLAVMVNGMALVTPAMPSFLALQAGKKNRGRTLALGGLASSLARMVGPLVLTPVFSTGATEGFAAAGSFAAFQVLVLVAMRWCCHATKFKMVRSNPTPVLAKHSEEEWLNHLRDKIAVMLKERNYDLRFRRPRQAVEDMIDRALPFLAATGEQRKKDINDLVHSLGEPPVFRKVPFSPPV